MCIVLESRPFVLRLNFQLLEKNELRDLIQNALAHFETVGYPSGIASTPSMSQSQPSQLLSSGGNWHRALRYMPPHLLALLNSKACRGAIMFNDPLTLDQCERLVDQLGRTDAPFQCAHGRPSLVPIIQVKGMAQQSKRRRRGIDWAGFMNEGRK